MTSKIADGTLGDVPVSVTVMDNGNVEATLVTGSGCYIAVSSPRGDFSVRSPSGEVIVPDGDGVFEAPGFYLRASGEQRCGGGTDVLSDRAGNVLFKVTSFLGAMCAGSTIHVLGDLEAVKTEIKYSIVGKDAFTDTKVFLPDGSTFETREVRPAITE